MGSEWGEMPFSEAVLINPPVQLEPGYSYPFVNMSALSPELRHVRATEVREFTGSGSRFQHGDTLMARITPCLENGKICRYYASPKLVLVMAQQSLLSLEGDQVSQILTSLTTLQSPMTCVNTRLAR
ncbi:MAG: hypothetical protein RMM17_04080 [Acidobacteriota bacterium]|nr:hypothetical protein [Blastocatellia bacterium]MDW8411841.1 hypothetical protein [Acidobacteriota bacterium]